MSITINGTTGISGVDGSSTAPAFQGNDTNTGLFYGTDIVGISTGGSERVRVDASGNVGIGTTSPSRKLDVSGASAAGSSIEIGNTNTQSSTLAAINTTGTTYSYAGVGGSTSWYYGSKTVALGNDSANPIQFVTNNSERMRINSSGFLMGAGNTSSTNFGLNWGGAQTTTAFNCAQIAGAFMGASGSGGGVDYTYVGYNFYTTTTNGTYKYAGGDFAAAIRYSGTIQTFTAVSGTANNNITWVAGPYVANSGTSWTNASDARLKNITGEISDAINKVSQLRAAEFTWKSDESNKPQVGLIAQDLQKVLPEVVVVPEKEFDGSSETALGVNYDQVIPLLVAAIKEQQTIINDLKARVTALEANNV